MAAGMFGANTDELRNIGNRFGSWSTEIDGTATTVHQNIDAVEWIGRDADTYRETWQGAFRIDLGAIRDRLKEHEDELLRHADEQDEASSAGGNEGCADSIGNGFSNALGHIGSFFQGLVVDGIWGDIVGIGSLLGFDENGWSFDTLKESWQGVGGLIGYDKSTGEWSWGTAGNSWLNLGKSMLAWDMWSEDPGRALGNVIWNFLPWGAAAKVSKLGMVGDVATVASKADNVADVAAVASKADSVADAATAASKVDDVATAASKADDVAAVSKADDVAAASKADDVAAASKADDVAPASVADDAVDASKADDAAASSKADDAADTSKADDAAASSKADEAADSSKADDANPRARDERWQQNDDVSPDVRNTDPRTDGASSKKMGVNNGPYDTGAHIDADGNLVSTSGRTFTADQVSEHWTTTTGSYNKSLDPDISGVKGDTPPKYVDANGNPTLFEPNHRYVLDRGSAVVETNANGMPDYHRWHVDRDVTSDAFKSKEFRNGSTIPTRDWPDDTHVLNENYNRGHAEGAANGGSNEGLNTPPQTERSNSLQNNYDNAINQAYKSDGDLVVERTIDYDGNEALGYDYRVTDKSGDIVDLKDKNGDVMPTYHPNHTQ